LKHADEVIPVFIADPKLLESPYVGAKRLAFMWGGLTELDSELRERGSRLILRQGNPRDELATLQSESGAEIIFAEEDISPYARLTA
jgi:deoxyribodipyrimidine photo-lyase